LRRAALLALAATVYALAAWMVAPGFYDGFGPPQQYNWTCPPPQAGANLKPSSGHLSIKVVRGVSDANSAFTDDGEHLNDVGRRTVARRFLHFLADSVAPLVDR